MELQQIVPFPVVYVVQKRLLARDAQQLSAATAAIPCIAQLPQWTSNLSPKVALSECSESTLDGPQGAGTTRW
jgi:hypothetical protein